MTVAELIAKLQKEPGDAIVTTLNMDGYVGEIGGVHSASTLYVNDDQMEYDEHDMDSEEYSTVQAVHLKC